MNSTLQSITINTMHAHDDRTRRYLLRRILLYGNDKTNSHDYTHLNDK